MIIYKIRNKKTGLFTLHGLQHDCWTRNGGRTWKRMGDLKSSMTNLFGRNPKHASAVDDLEIVAFDVVESTLAVPTLIETIIRAARK